MVAAAAGVSCGLAPLAVSAVVDHRRPETIAILVATIGAAAVFAALTVSLVGTISEREVGAPAAPGAVIATTAAVVTATVASMIQISRAATLTAAVAATAALAIGYCGPSTRDRAEVGARRRLLADALGTPPAGCRSRGSSSRRARRTPNTPRLAWPRPSAAG